MPFSLKNTDATYQRAMVTLFHDIMHKEIEVYVDDMIAKSCTTRDHFVRKTHVCIAYKTYFNGSTSFTIDNMYYVNFRI